MQGVDSNSPKLFHLNFLVLALSECRSPSSSITSWMYLISLWSWFSTSLLRKFTRQGQIYPWYINHWVDLPVMNPLQLVPDLILVEVVHVTGLALEPVQAAFVFVV